MEETGCCLNASHLGPDVGVVRIAHRGRLDTR